MNYYKPVFVLRCVSYLGESFVTGQWDITAIACFPGAVNGQQHLLPSGLEISCLPGALRARLWVSFL